MPALHSSILLWVLCPAVIAQVDPFVSAIETIKQSVVSMDCLWVSPAEVKVRKVIGSGFLVSESGDFLTAAHVLAAMAMEKDCKSAFTLPTDGWRPAIGSEQLLWFPFKYSDCKIGSDIDVAECRLRGELQANIRQLHLKAAQLEWGIPPDGTQVAFTGFPLESRDPMTFRAHLAAYRAPLPNLFAPELIIDHPSLPGYSGSPVYMADGKVAGILVADGRPDAPGTAIARPVLAFRETLLKTPAR